MNTTSAQSPSWPVPAVLLMLAVLALAWWHSRGLEVAQLAAASAATSAAPAVESAVPPAIGRIVVADRDEAEPATPAPADASGVRFPDGSLQPALNGVTALLDIPWPSGRPFAPVVEQLHHNGADWYRHADGTFTTTIVRIEAVSGKELQIPLCFTPQPAPATQQLRTR